MKLQTILTYLAAAAIFVGWGITWANQNAKIAENKACIDVLNRRVDDVTQKTTDSEKTIVRMETKIEYIIKGVDEIKAEVKSQRTP